MKLITGKPADLPSAQMGVPADNNSAAHVPVDHATTPQVAGTSATRLTTASFKKIKSTSTREELVALFGPPRTTVTPSEVAEKLLGNPNWGIAYETEVTPNNNPMDMLAYLEEGRVLIIGIARNEPAQGEARIVRAWLATRNGDTRTGTLTYETLLGDDGPLKYSKNSAPVPAANR